MVMILHLDRIGLDRIKGWFHLTTEWLFENEGSKEWLRSMDQGQDRGYWWHLSCWHQPFLTWITPEPQFPAVPPPSHPVLCNPCHKLLCHWLTSVKTQGVWWWTGNAATSCNSALKMATNRVIHACWQPLCDSEIKFCCCKGLEQAAQTCVRWGWYSHGPESVLRALFLLPHSLSLHYWSMSRDRRSLYQDQGTEEQRLPQLLLAPSCKL